MPELSQLLDVGTRPGTRQPHSLADIADLPVPVPRTGTPLNALALPWLPSSAGGFAAMVKVCFNCGAQHNSRDCPDPKDERCVSANLQRVREFGGPRPDEQRWQKDGGGREVDQALAVFIQGDDYTEHKENASGAGAGARGHGHSSSGSGGADRRPGDRHRGRERDQGREQGQGGRPGPSHGRDNRGADRGHSQSGPRHPPAGRFDDNGRDRDFRQPPAGHGHGAPVRRPYDSHYDNNSQYHPPPSTYHAHAPQHPVPPPRPAGGNWQPHAFGPPQGGHSKVPPPPAPPRRY
jgi:hypothetical protein